MLVWRFIFRRFIFSRTMFLVVKFKSDLFNIVVRISMFRNRSFKYKRKYV